MSGVCVRGLEFRTVWAVDRTSEVINISDHEAGKRSQERLQRLESQGRSVRGNGKASKTDWSVGVGEAGKCLVLEGALKQGT